MSSTTALSSSAPSSSASRPHVRGRHVVAGVGIVGLLVVGAITVPRVSAPAATHAPTVVTTLGGQTMSATERADSSAQRAEQRRIDAWSRRSAHGYSLPPRPETDQQIGGRHTGVSMTVG
jgi:hypothetical protein